MAREELKWVTDHSKVLPAIQAWWVKWDKKNEGEMKKYFHKEKKHWSLQFCLELQNKKLILVMITAISIYDEWNL